MQYYDKYLHVGYVVIYYEITVGTSTMTLHDMDWLKVAVEEDVLGREVSGGWQR